MSKDIKVFTACDHTVNGEVYRSDMCVKCLGRGYYLDIMFDDNGEIVTTDGAIKLQQEVLKAILDQKGSNPFHLPWGSDVYKIPGHKNIAITRTKLEMVIRRALEYLRSLQKQEAKSNLNYTDDEILGEIEQITITPVSVLGWSVSIQFSNQEREVMLQGITV